MFMSKSGFRGHAHVTNTKPQRFKTHHPPINAFEYVDASEKEVEEVEEKEEEVDEPPEELNVPFVLHTPVEVPRSTCVKMNLLASLQNKNEGSWVVSNRSRGKNDNVSEEVLEKRRYNNRAVKISRQRKILYRQQLESNVQKLKDERDRWRTRSIVFEKLLLNEGILIDDANPMPETFVTDSDMKIPPILSNEVAELEIIKTKRPPYISTDEEKLAWKRKKDALAGRVYRKRELVHKEHLEKLFERLTVESKGWQVRAISLRELLIDHKVDFQDLESN
ncbi:hypothetical protein BDQ17DRAFT_1332826 [Cyathus striatus]|nr:hypothetical protein BDQ17DRAFT_1332826 [Cyathus striatus]